MHSGYQDYQSRLLFVICIALLSAACSATHQIRPGETLELQGSPRLYDKEGRRYQAKTLRVDQEKVQVISGYDEGIEEIPRADASMIKQRDHAKGMVRGASYGALTGLGMGLLSSIGQGGTTAVVLPVAGMFGLLGGGIGLLTGFTDTYHFLHSDSSYIPLPKAKLKERSRFYLGIETGPSWLETPSHGTPTDIGTLVQAQSVSSTFEFGMTINPHTLLGIRFDGYSLNDYNSFNTYRYEMMSGAMLVTTLFPKGKGAFWRIGFGMADYYFDAYDYYDQYNLSETTYKSEVGLSNMFSLGYAFWTGEHVNITLSADMHNYFFRETDTSHMFTTRIGIYWY